MNKDTKMTIFWLAIGAAILLFFAIAGTTDAKAGPVSDSIYHVEGSSLSPSHFLKWDKLTVSIFNKGTQTYLYIIFSNPKKNTIKHQDITVVSAIFDKFDKATQKPTGPVLRYSYRYSEGGEIFTLERQSENVYRRKP
ncbi:hypothetical protein HNV12_01535 [Methanococcoides sp. SA1]|nr:hypothetical protein [Methanococcoides sp. SA1]